MSEADKKLLKSCMSFCDYLAEELYSVGTEEHRLLGVRLISQSHQLHQLARRLD